MMQNKKHGLLTNLAFLGLADPARSVTLPIKFGIFFVESFPGGWFSSGLLIGSAIDFPGVFFNVFLLCRLKCANFSTVSSLLS